jgi:PAS domain S-box-containing protein
MGQGSAPIAPTPIALDRDTFMRQLIASLGLLNEGILGSDVAGAYIMNVGLSMGAAIEAEYKRFWAIDRPFTVDEYTHVIIDLKQKINGNFSLVANDPTKVVVRTTSCPFDAFVRQSPSLCFMTSSVFGGIAARNFGYAKVVLHKRIALGDPGCYVTVHLQRTAEAECSVGKEYYPDIDQASPDIAEQLRLMDRVRRLHRQLSETTSQWEALVRGAAEAICVLTPAGAVHFANARWREVLGVEGEELVGSELLHLAHPDDLNALGGHVADATEGVRVTGRTYRLRHRDTTWRELLTSLSPLRDEAGALIGVLGIFHDVTEEQAARRLKDHFLSMASHELRTPITAIKALTDLVQRTLDTRGAIDSAQLARRLASIQREADRLALLSMDLLDVSRLHTGTLPIHHDAHDLTAIVAAAVERQRDVLGDAARHALVLRQPTDPIPVRVERTRLEQVMSNLLENAVKYAPDGGTIQVMTSVAGQSAQIQVTDPGIGIPAADLSKIFTPFFRAANASSRTFMGLGLGLYLSKALIEAHGGTITVHSVEGQGTTFTVTLPIQDGGMT